MAETSRNDSWQMGANYDAYMGRWSRRIAEPFLDWLAVAPGRDWLEVGCGTGSVSSAILAHAAPGKVTALDSSEDFLRHAEAALADPRMAFHHGDAQALNLPDASHDAVVSGLVLNFVPDRVAMLSEMARVTRPGGTAAVFVWDYPGGGVGFMDAFWRAAAALDPEAVPLAEDRRFPDCNADGLAALAGAAGWHDPEVRAIEIPTPFRDFEDLWHPFTLGSGPAPGYCARLSPDARERLRQRLDAEIPRAADGTIALTARAWAVKTKRRG